MKTMTFGGVEFIFDLRNGKDRAQSQDNRFVIVKSDALLAHYEQMKPRAPRTIMEIGVFQGGSMVYFDKLFSPEKIVGVDFKRDPIPALDRYIENNPQMKMYYGRWQDKPGTLMAARENFPNGVDLVIDDASHLYEQSKATFEMLFPLVRAGGEYVIEDWAWAHGGNRQGPNGVWHDKPALTNLVFEIVVLSSMKSIIESVLVTADFVSVRRGPEPAPPQIFDLTPLLRGRPMPRI